MFLLLPATYCGIPIALVIHSLEGISIALAILSLDPLWGF